MKIYIRNKDDFSIRRMIECSTWKISFDLRNGSSFTIPEELPEVDGCIVCVYGTPEYIGLCETSSISDGATTINCVPLIKLFNRDVLLPALDGSGNTKQAATVINSEFKACTDTMFAIPWLTASYTAETTDAQPELDTRGMANLYEWILDRIEKNAWNVSISQTNSGATISLYPFGSTTKIYDFTTGRHQLTKEARVNEVVSKITTHVSTDKGATWTDTDYYLFDDGTFDTDPTAGTRVAGRWIHLTNPEDNDIEDEFKRNEFNDEIEFYTYDLPTGIVDGHNVRIKLLNGRIIDTVITSCSISNSDDRYLIKCGNVISTFSAFISNIQRVSAKNSTDTRNIKSYIKMQ